MTDFRALCTELLNQLHGYASANPHHDSDALAAAPNEPAAPEAAGPSDADLHAMAFGYSQPCYQFEYIPFARAVLARWGRPAALPAPAVVPVAVSERLPGPSDCDAEGFCWFWSPEDLCWFWERIDSGFCRRYGAEFDWLPARALPLPSGEVEG